MRSKHLWQAVILSASLVLLLISGSGAQAQGVVYAPHGWVRVAAPGFGIASNVSTSALRVYNNQLYAATINWATGASIFRTSNGTDWQMVAFPGQVSNIYNPAVTDMIVFNNRLYVGTAWSGQGSYQWNYQVWRYDGTTWQNVIDNAGYPVHGFTAFEVFNNALYIGVFMSWDAHAGANILRSTTGDPGSWQIVMSNGKNNPNSYAMTSLKAFNGYLYAAMGNEVDGVQVIRSNDGVTWETVVNSGFAGPCTANVGGVITNVNCNWDAGGFSVFNNALYLGARNEIPREFNTPNSKGGVLYRTTDGVTWNPVTVNGFGNPNNVKIEGTVTFNSTLYALTFNAQVWETPATGMQVWASADGINFVPVRMDGFGSIFNTNSLWSNAQEVFNNHLFIGTSNKEANHGGELFMSADTVMYLPLTMR